MTTEVQKPKTVPLILKFGGGNHTRASEADIDPRESASGENFVLDLENREFRNRPGFENVGTVPNGSQINGFVQLKKQDGTTSTLVQAGTTVYEWDGTDFTSVGTVDTDARLRGPLSANWELSNKVLISDMALQEPLKEWDGTTFQDVSHNLSGNFLCKYAFVIGERAYYANVVSNSTATPHMIVGSTLSDYTTLSVSDRPSSSLSTSDPFFLLTPDLRPINGIVGAFGVIAVSSLRGSMFKIVGSDATDFAIEQLYSGSAASGDEPVAYVGNDIYYGRQGRIESMSGSVTFGDVETDDISRYIADQITAYKDWTLVFNSRLQRVYCFPKDKAEVHVLFKSILDEVTRKRVQYAGTSSASPEFSPWSKWTTRHALQFKPTAVMNMYDPVDGLEYVFMGDASGNIYRLESDSYDDDGSSVKATRTSMLFAVPLDLTTYDIEGYVQYRKNEAANIDVKIKWGGSNAYDSTSTVAITAVSDSSYYSGGAYYGGGAYYSSPTRSRFLRVPFSVTGREESFQIVVTVDGTKQVNIQELGLIFRAV